MAVLKIKSVPQKYADPLAYQQLSAYIMRADKTPNCYIGGFAVHPQYAAEEMMAHLKLAAIVPNFGSVTAPT